MFWSKAECDGCHQKVKQSKLAYYRGCSFCSDACRAAWVAENPPAVAKGEPAKLRRDLQLLVAAAMREWKTMGGQVRADIFTMIDALPVDIPLLSGLTAIERADIFAGAKMRFIQHACETIPLLNALGYDAEATVLQSFDFGRDVSMAPIAGALDRAHARAALP